MNNKNNIKKPITLAIEETKMELVNTLNTSELPIFALNSIVKDLYNEINLAYIEQLKIDKQTYTNSLNQKNEESDK